MGAFIVQEPYDSVLKVLTKLQFKAAKGDLTGIYEATAEVIDLVKNSLEATTKSGEPAPKTNGKKTNG